MGAPLPTEAPLIWTSGRLAEREVQIASLDLRYFAERLGEAAKDVSRASVEPYPERPPAPVRQEPRAVRDPEGAGAAGTGPADRFARNRATTAELLDVRSLPARVGFVHAARFSRDGATLATAGVDRLIRLWDVSQHDPTEICTLAGHADEVGSVAFSPDGLRLASGGFRHDCSVRFWDLETRQQLAVLKPGAQDPQRSSLWVYSLAFSRDGRRLAVPADPHAGADGLLEMVKIWDLHGSGPTETATLAHPGWGVSSLDFSPDGARLACAQGEAHLPPTESGIVLWDLTAEPPQRTAELHGVEFEIHVSFAPDGRMLAAGGRGGTIFLWDVSAAQPVEQSHLRGHGGDLVALAYHPSGKELFAAHLDGRLALWDVASGRELGRWSQPLELCDATLSADGERVAMCGSKGREGVVSVARLLITRESTSAQ